MAEARSIAQQLRQFIIENFLYGQERAFADDASFLAEGIVDSTGVLQLVTFLEETYGITVDDEDLIPENLDSINCVTTYICGKTNTPAGICSTEGESVRGRV
jgi:acyl carrier protein